MPKVSGVIPSAAAEVPYHSAKRTRLEYSTVAKTDPSYNPREFTEVSIVHFNESAHQVKAIKDSVKPNKLQSLEHSGKKDDTKQLDEIELELSDQPIYADSSCPPTPNFKKEWDKSD
ncbi:hypothetical protein BB561_000745 [Smittium simulii]|uniref:Uncharacterized protein n=1 Tax=Smittium simulii TaxID=133385 RepID=A0A2T9YXQ3_9FUNG|nr:hypothetical protein BB561_000745 [Smittium simulii]